MPWIEYSKTRTGAMPVVSAKLAMGSDVSFPIKFLVDSGASISTVPRNRVAYMLTGVSDVERDSGCVDANGKPIMGVPIEFSVILGHTDIPQTTERIWVMPAGDWPLLGQTWFERFALRFHNFSAAPKGRRFAIQAPKF